MGLVAPPATSSTTTPATATPAPHRPPGHTTPTKSLHVDLQIQEAAYLRLRMVKLLNTVPTAKTDL
jgi:hypothetical protein